MVKEMEHDPEDGEMFQGIENDLYRMGWEMV